jgi:hypothetical protein
MSNFIYYPDADITIILLNNFGNYGESLWPVNMGLSAILFNKNNGNWSIHKEVDIAEKDLEQYKGLYVYNKQHSLVINYSGGKLFVEATNPRDQLPKLQLHFEGENRFYITEANLSFEFIKNTDNNYYKLISYRGTAKDAEWIKK